MRVPTVRQSCHCGWWEKIRCAPDSDVGTFWSRRLVIRSYFSLRAAPARRHLAQLQVHVRDVLDLVVAATLAVRHSRPPTPNSPCA